MNNKLVIGGAQLGIPSYGITNTSVSLKLSEIENLFATASKNRIEYVDTARDYGRSEEILGAVLAQTRSKIKIVTKLSSFTGFPKNCNKKLISKLVLESISQSKDLLGRPIDCLMLHRAEHFWAWDGEIWNTLLSLRDTGCFKSLGVSVQTPEELERLLSEPEIKFFQIPFNILDWRWGHLVGQILAEKKKRSLLIHARSSLLQGLLVSEDVNLWTMANCSTPSLYIEGLKVLAEETGVTSVVNLCLAYARSQEWIDGVVVGMETNSQLRENISFFNERELTPSELKKIAASLPKLGDQTLNPMNWKSE
jgi:aryl-alcohol dehydrogenase-like predicted oxidoreductase